MKSAVLITIPLLLWGTILFAAEKYGDAILEEGAMTILREGETLNFNTAGESIEVFEQDLLRLRAKSRVILNSRENAILTLGSNAIFQVKPWEQNEESGFLRALFGRFRAAVTDLVGGEEFNVKTATATIGIKGTEYIATITSQGNAMLVVTENSVAFQGLVGPPQIVGENLVSVVVGANPATPPAPVPPAVLEALSGDNLDSPPPNAPGAADLPGEEGLINAGIVTEEQLEKGKEDEPDFDADADGEGDVGVETPEIDEIDLEEAKENLFRGDVRIDFQQ